MLGGLYLRRAYIVGKENGVENLLLEGYIRFYSNEVSEKIRCIPAILPGIEDTQQKKTALIDALEPLLRRSKGLPTAGTV